jgi:NADH:ubiquinone oxidoreductase subunit F (NADH-binding)
MVAAMNSGFLLPVTPLPDLKSYQDLGGGTGLANARRIGTAATIEQIRAAGLRGRGGAGFPTAFKWQGLVNDPASPKYLACNAAEGEPGTFKDRALLRANPYQLLEGVTIAAETLGVEQAFIGIKGTFLREIARLESAAEEMLQAGLLGDIPITISPGPDDYLFGEEKGLLEAIEGRDARPRIDPPYIRGLFVTRAQPSNPAVVNNVETLSNVAHILANGPDWFRSFGTEKSPGTMIFTVSGDVQKETVVELPLGTPLATLVFESAGGMAPGRRLKAVVSGASNAPLPGAMVDTPMDYESMKAVGAGLGSGGMIVYDDTASMVDAALVLSNFLSDSSCGQCIPCKVGSTSITERLRIVADGKGTPETLDEIAGWIGRVTDSNRCGLGAGERTLVRGFLDTFWDEFVAQLDTGVPIERRLRLPKLMDLDEEAGRFVYAD